MSDPLVEESHAVREKLLREFGGLDGLCDRLEELDRQRLARKAAKKVKPPRTKLASPKRARKRPA